MSKIVDLYSEYQRKKYFPQKYKDPYGELIDHLNNDSVNTLLTNWKTSRNRGLLQIAMDLAQLIPSVQHRDLYSEYLQAYRKQLPPPNCPPEFAFFYLRKLPVAERNDFWKELNDWAVRTESRMFDWHHARIEVESKFTELHSEYQNAFQMNYARDLKRIESSLTSTYDRFALEGHEQSLTDIFESFRMEPWKDIFDWNDFFSLAQSFFETCSIRRHPKLQKSKLDEGMQFCFPISPPTEVILEYGTAAGPPDAVRFIAQLSKACFYSNINPELPAEFRFSGDPRIVPFWSALYTLAFIRKSGLRVMVGTSAEELADPLERFLFFWLRYDGFLALYRNAAESDLRVAKDQYSENWQKAFTFEAPVNLYLYELDRSTSAIHRVIAMQSALVVEERLRTLYGNTWFASSQCVARIQDYWWSGFNLSLAQVLQDLDINFES